MTYYLLLYFCFSSTWCRVDFCLYLPLSSSHRKCRHITSSFSIAFLSSLFVVCLFEPVPTSIVLQPRDLSMSFCLIHTESVCLLSNPFIYSHFPFSASFLLHPSLSFSCHSHIAHACAAVSSKLCKNSSTAELILEVETHFCKVTHKYCCAGRLRSRDGADMLTWKMSVTCQVHL